jgi:hypothetical protein
MAILLKGTDENFNKVLANRENNKFSKFDLPKPLMTFGSQDKLKNASLNQKVGLLDTSRSAPLYNDPRYTSSTLAIPTDERSLHGLYRFFAETDPIVGASLKILSELPLADFRLGQCEDTGIQQHFEEMWDRINGNNLINNAVAEHWEIGSVTLFGAYNEADYMWDQFSILNPDYVKIESTWINETPLIKLIPDEALKKIVQTQNPKALYNQIPNEIKKYVLFNQEIPLSPQNTFLLSHAKRPYETKGRSVIKRILKILMLEDKFNQANFAIASRHAVPFTVVKVGDPGLAWLPTDEDLQLAQEAISAWELDPNFSYITHPGFSIDYYGSNGHSLPVGPELDRIYRLKFIGLGVHEQLLAGQGGSYSQAYMSLEIQRQRYLNLQLKLEQLFHNGIFKPIADLCGFYRVRQAVAGYSGVRKVGHGGEDKLLQEIKKAYKTNEYENPDFKEFIIRKTAEYRTQQAKLTKEYVFPKLDFGALNAAYDENMKNYIKWLADKRPELVDDATLARLAKLDRDDQYKAQVSDLKRKRDFYAELKKEGLLELFQAKNSKGGAGGADMGPIDMGTGGALDINNLGGGGEEPNLPTGVGGAPESVSGQTAPQGVATSAEGLRKLVFSDDVAIMNENKMLLKKKNGK